MQEKYSNIIIDFLKSHPRISVLGLEKELKLPSGTLQHPKAGLRKIPEKHIYPIVCHLADYGLKIDGYTLTHDSSDDTLTGRKWLEDVKTIELHRTFIYVVKECRMFAGGYFDLM